MAIKISKESKKRSLKGVYFIVVLIIIFIAFLFFRKIKNLKNEIVVEEEFNITQGLEKISVEKIEKILEDPVFLSLKSYLPKLIPTSLGTNLGKENLFK
ncbi:hypothetical protein J7J41_02725 [bacterium]|nr:hypothetical protein [bacterium]